MSAWDWSDLERPSDLPAVAKDTPAGHCWYCGNPIDQARQGVGYGPHDTTHHVVCFLFFMHGPARISRLTPEEYAASDEGEQWEYRVQLLDYWTATTAPAVPHYHIPDRPDLEEPFRSYLAAEHYRATEELATLGIDPVAREDKA